MGIRGSKNEVFVAILLGGLRTEFPRFLGPAYYGRKCWWFLKSKRKKEIEFERPCAPEENRRKVPGRSPKKTQARVLRALWQKGRPMHRRLILVLLTPSPSDL